MYKFIVKCNKCGNTQKLVSRKQYPNGRKICVYCGKGFSLNHKTILCELR